jgi:hypothetical protein
VAAGIATVVLAVLLFGLTTASGALDWVSVVTAFGGLVLAAEGFFMTFHTSVHH